jgi:hypothetical protein
LRNTTSRLLTRLDRLSKRKPLPSGPLAFWDALANVRPLPADPADIDPRSREMLEEAAAQLADPATDRVEDRIADALADGEAAVPRYVYGLREWPAEPGPNGPTPDSEGCQ